MSSFFAGGNLTAVVKSVGVIIAINFVQGVIANMLLSTTQYGAIISAALSVYLYFAAYAQGWISVPAGLFLAA